LSDALPSYVRLKAHNKYSLSSFIYLLFVPAITF
jgi:hypothetical protein